MLSSSSSECRDGGVDDDRASSSSELGSLLFGGDGGGALLFPLPLPFSVLLDLDRFESEDFLFFFLEAARLRRLSSPPTSPLPSSLLLPLSLLAAAAPDRRTSISRLICRWFLERRLVSTRLASPSPAEDSSSSRPLPSEAFSGDKTFGRRRRSGGTL